MSTASESVGTALPKLMAYIRDEVLPVYLSIGAPGAFATTMIRMDLDAATVALAEGDLPKIIAAYQRLKDIKL